VSAQDDVLAAFGEWPFPKKTEPAPDQPDQPDEEGAAEPGELEGPRESGEQSLTADEVADRSGSSAPETAGGGSGAETPAEAAPTKAAGGDDAGLTDDGGASAPETAGEASTETADHRSASATKAASTEPAGDVGTRPVEHPAASAVSTEPAGEVGTKAVEHPAASVAEVASTAEATAIETGSAAADHHGAPAPEADAPGAAPSETTALAAAAQPYLDPAAFFTQLQAESAPQKPKPRWSRLVLRYGAAVVVAGAVAAGTMFAISLPRRTDVPFLATPTDGRYDFPPMVRPAPPVGKPAPGDDANAEQIHYGDLRQYLVPVPKGAALKEDGWEPVADFGAGFAASDVGWQLADEGLRHVAQRGWTTPDGRHTVVELAQFPDHQAAFGVRDLSGGAPRKVGRGVDVLPPMDIPTLGETTYQTNIVEYDTVDGAPGQTERRVVFQTGDVIAIVTTTAPRKWSDVATEQVVLLEAEMLR
jgi:hypothetical protein